MQNPTTPQFLTPRALAERWHVSEKTLERWRMHGTGPAYCKIGGRVLYALAQVQDHERRRLRAATGRSLPPSADLTVCREHTPAC